MGETPREISIPITEAVSDTLEAPMEELPPLSTAIDLDGLDAIVTNNQSHNVTVTFSYAGLQVLVHSDSTVYVRPLHGGYEDPLQTEYINN